MRLLALTVAQQVGWTVRSVWATVQSNALGAMATGVGHLLVAADMCWSQCRQHRLYYALLLPMTPKCRVVPILSDPARLPLTPRIHCLL